MLGIDGQGLRDAARDHADECDVLYADHRVEQRGVLHGARTARPQHRREFPPIRVWGTVGFIVAMWTVDFAGWTKSALQLYVSAGAAALLGLYAFTMPKCPPVRATGKRSILSALGLDAFVLFRHTQMLVFFTFAVLLGAALQITNAFGSAFLADFKTLYPDSFGVRHPNLLLSISQISQTLFILTIPFFLKRFGIKVVMLMSIFAWVFRFGLFALGDPGAGLWMLILSMIIYGMAFDFFNISGSLYVEREAEPSIRASAQGLYMIMINGFGAFFGSTAAGCRRSLHCERREGLAQHLARVRRLCARPRGDVPVPVQIPGRSGGGGRFRSPFEVTHTKAPVL